jgi:4a-hydroxytetrahydrobiopterin dehydratase
MWEEKNGKLQKMFVFKDFVEAFSFLTKVAFLAEKQNHHPEIFNVYNRVELYLCTHDADNKITEKDRNLARSIDLI